MIAYSLRRKSDGADVAQFSSIPGFLTIPDTEITVMGADENWSNDDYGFVQIELPDPPISAEPTPLEKLQAAGLTVADLKSLLGLS